MREGKEASSHGGVPRTSPLDTMTTGNKYLLIKIEGVTSCNIPPEKLASAKTIESV